MNLVIRADANGSVGTGHLMRCLALGQVWRDHGGQVTLVTACLTKSLIGRFYDEGCKVVRFNGAYPDSRDWQITSETVAQFHEPWLVLDGYNFDLAYQRAVREAGYRLLVIDDTARLPKFHTDVLLNQNIDAKRLTYRCNPDAMLLLGTRYVLLRKEFLKWRGLKRNIRNVSSRILVTLGGGDPNNVTLKVIRVLQQLELPELEARIVVGPANPYLEALRQEVKRSTCNLQLLTDVTNMPELMAWADVAVSSGGSTCWELAFMQLPSVIVVMADNQRPIAESLHKAGVALNVGTYQNLSFVEIAQAVRRLLVATVERREMAGRGKELVDGEGANRVLLSMRSGNLSLRHVRKDDCRLLWEWANDPKVRSASFSENSIPWERHVEWFNSKLNGRNCIFYVAVDNYGMPVGPIRRPFISI